MRWLVYHPGRECVRADFPPSARTSAVSIFKEFFIRRVQGMIRAALGEGENCFDRCEELVKTKKLIYATPDFCGRPVGGPKGHAPIKSRSPLNTDHSEQSNTPHRERTLGSWLGNRFNSDS